MLIKLIKYDFTHSAKTFFGLGAIALVLAAILGTAIQTPLIFMTGSAFTLYVFVLAFFGIAIAAVIQIFLFYKSSVFGRAGHLMLTMPVSSGKILASKLIVSYAWFLYSVAVAFAAVALITAIVETPATPRRLLQVFDADTTVIISMLMLLAFFAIALLFFTITLANSAVAGRRMGAVPAGVAGIAAAAIFGFLASALSGRAWEEQMVTWQSELGSIHTWTSRMPLVGLQYGRIPVAYTYWGQPIYIDLFFVLLTIAATAAAIAATHELLKRRIVL